MFTVHLIEESNEGHPFVDSLIFVKGVKLKKMSGLELQW
jgi:hypothetical protein